MEGICQISWYEAGDLLIKLAGGVLVALGAFFGARQYSDTRKRELYGHFWNERMRVYLVAADAAARCRHRADTMEGEKARQDFFNLYHGQMSVIEDRLVNDAMEKFAELIKGWDAQSTGPSNDEFEVKINDLQRDMNISLRKPWGDLFREMESREKLS